MMRSLVILSLLAFLAGDTVAQAPRKLRVLLVVDGTAKTRDEFQRMLALELDVAKVTHDKLPAAVADYSGFDAVILSDIPVNILGQAQIKALDVFTTNGGALLVAGGERSFTKGGYQGTRLESMLPIRFDADAKPQAKIGVVFVVDTTEAMKGKQLEGVLDSINAYAAAMSPDDTIAIVTYDITARVAMKPVAANSKAKLAAELARIKTNGISTASILDGLKEGYQIAQSISAPAKHVVLISGETSKNAGIAALVDEMRGHRITTSTVGYFPKASRPLLTTISTKGDGRVHGYDDAAKLTRFLADDLAAAVKASPQGAYARVAKKDVIIDGTGVDRAPAMGSYAQLKPKPTAHVFLITDDGQPLLSRWCYGTGRVAVWGSDLDGAWSGDWPRWAGYAKFWTQVVREVHAHSCKK